MRTLSTILIGSLCLSFGVTVLAVPVRALDLDDVKIESAEAKLGQNGNYKVFITLNQKLTEPSAVDSAAVKEFHAHLKQPMNFLLKEIRTDREIPVTELELTTALDSTDAELYRVILRDVDITFREAYTIEFRRLLPPVGPKEISFTDSSDVYAEWEKDKSTPWQNSFAPKIAQGDSTISELGDIGFDISLRKKVGRDFAFNFNGSATLNKDDPNNHWQLGFNWRSDVLLVGDFIALRPVSASVSDDATQALRFHESSISLFSSLALHPIKGIQPLFMTAGVDEALRTDLDGEDFDDARLHFQAQWGFIGLVGKGSSFFVDFQYWRRMNGWTHEIDPTAKKERHFVQLEFVLPVTEGKNLKIRYADGDVAPTFVEDTSVHLGLEFFVAGYLIDPK